MSMRQQNAVRQAPRVKIKKRLTVKAHNIKVERTKDAVQSIP